ncbi:hypothetical protein IX321_002423 [Bacteroides pyogenes]|nr:hypothetical protein [Bacteroides pyogenes]MBR8718496.1 hypothetical protein [Bacteroides pyogenes]MBR8747959.1 hypothetical protein [Bacteroides pyogenes]MBR8758250.1 hypothetical protein [Bacteroides pyogenes]MBR8781489.1 hypothetical protein [Bacteroides pyogenes]
MILEPALPFVMCNRSINYYGQNGSELNVNIYNLNLLKIETFLQANSYLKK